MAGVRANAAKRKNSSVPLCRILSEILWDGISFPLDWFCDNCDLIEMLSSSNVPKLEDCRTKPVLEVLYVTFLLALVVLISAVFSQS